MNIQQIEYVLAVSKYKNFGLAAKNCFITQSTLSTMIARFEEEIGISIFDRKTKPVTVTKEGAAIICQLKSISKELGILEELVQELKGELSGKIKIGVLPTIAPYLLPIFLNDFASKFPKLTFEVSEINTATIKDLILKRELDIGIVAIPLEEKDFTEIPLYNEAFVLYDYESNPKKNSVSINNLDFNRFWLLEEGHCLRTQVEKICEFDSCKNKEGINFEFKAGSIDSLTRFVKKNKGMTLLPYLATLDFSEAEKEKLSYFKAPIPVRTIGLVVHRHFVKKQILELLQSEIQEKVPPLLNSLKSKEKIYAPF
jgi:LysR family hydrogen peroxide-inducible transcriptional activator